MTIKVELQFDTAAEAADFFNALADITEGGEAPQTGATVEGNAQQPAKRGRGRPPKNPPAPASSNAATTAPSSPTAAEAGAAAPAQSTSTPAPQPATAPAAAANSAPPPAKKYEDTGIPAKIQKAATTKRAELVALLTSSGAVGPDGKPNGKYLKPEQFEAFEADLDKLLAPVDDLG